MDDKSTVLRICHLYARLLNIYGDRGNIITWTQRATWRGMSVEIRTPGLDENIDPDWADIYFIGGGQDKQQIAIAADLQKHAHTLKQATDNGAVILAVCGGYQLLGHYYKPHQGPELKGISLIDAYTVAGDRRMIGNVTVELSDGSTLVGFENHSGKTFLGNDTTPIGRVVKGNGNNGEDGFEGVHHKNIYGTYLHGSLLPKNPQFADQLIGYALARRYGQIKLSALIDNEEVLAHQRALTLKA
jgi:CobQ-like glutamine amidotransferase family enzyme